MGETCDCRTIALIVQPFIPEIKGLGFDILKSVIVQNYNMSRYCRNLVKLWIQFYEYLQM